MADEDSDGYEIEKPPERRAPSSRASRGSRMGKLLAEEEEEEGDADFYTQEFWAEAEGDGEYADDGDDEAARDSFDSDFGDSTESDDEDDDDDKQAKQKDAKVARKKSVYKDPKEKKVAAASSSAAEKKSHKRQRSEVDALGGPAAFERGSLRTSTQGKSEEQRARLERDEERAKAREQRRQQTAKTKGSIELRRLTQAEILAEAKQTEIINRASLEKMQRIEEEKRKVIVRDRDVSGARIKFVSKRQGDSVVNTLSFVGCEVAEEINAVAPPYPPLLRCAATGLPAKFFDAVTNQPYATLEAFQRLRGRTGRRSSWPTSNDGSALPGTLAAAAPAGES